MTVHPYSSRFSIKYMYRIKTVPIKVQFIFQPQKWPGEVAGFKETVLNLCEVSTILGYIVLKLMGVGLQLEVGFKLL